MKEIVRKIITAIGVFGSLAGILVFLFGDAIIPKILEKLNESDPWVSISSIKRISYDEETNIATFEATVDYSLTKNNRAKLAIHANWQNQDSWTGLNNGWCVIENGVDSKKFTVSLTVPEWNENLSFIAYIHPYSGSEEGWDWIARSNKVEFPVAHEKKI